MYDVITIGTATRDVFLTSPLFRVFRDPEHLKKLGFAAGEAQCFALGAKVGVDDMVLTSGGGATNAAVTFARQGLKTAALIKVGNDEAAESIRKELLKEKVRPMLAYEDKKGTAYSTILLAVGGERTILVYRGASEDLTLKDVKNLPASRWAYITPGAIDFKVIKTLVEELHRRGVLMAINPSKAYIQMGLKKLQPILNKMKAVILNREEASYLTGVPYNNEKGIFKTLDKVVLGIAVMTEGPKGVLVSDGTKMFRAGIFKEKMVADRTGAGDAFGSGFVAGLIHKKETCSRNLCRPVNVEYAVRLGSANATSVVEYIGAKEGILRKSDFNSSRWKNLQVWVQS